MMYSNNIISILITAAMLMFCCSKKDDEKQVMRLVPKQHDVVQTLPKKHNFWIFLMAGQSNMAGRGVVEAIDTLPNTRVLALDSNNQWYVAKEPLHFYEPKLKGLDCGLSFANRMVRSVNDSVCIGIIPCAIGGSSIEQWLGDSLHRNVKLYSNFESKVEQALEHGTIKGILWHQGESNAHEKDFKDYAVKLNTLFDRFRTLIQNDTLPILTAELGYYLTGKDFQHYPDSVNATLKKMAAHDKNIKVISAKDLQHKGDTLHFDSKSQRVLGERFAEAYEEIVTSF